jgi:tetratricopeptide (TPR) repeat protein
MAYSRTLLGKLLLKREQTDRAIVQFQEALKLEPDNVAAAYQLAQAYRNNGEAERSKELFAKVSQLRSPSAACGASFGWARSRLHPRPGFIRWNPIWRVRRAGDESGYCEYHPSPEVTPLFLTALASPPYTGVDDFRSL